MATKTRRRGFAIARPAAPRRGPSTALVKAREQLQKARKSAAAYRRKVADSQMPQAGLNAALMVGGSAGAGLVRAVMPEIGPVQTDVGLGIAATVGGVALGQPWLLYLGAGMVAPAISEWVEESVAGMLEGSSDAGNASNVAQFAA